LLPIMWSPAMQAGADVMKRIATPMIGGIITSAIMELLIYPVIYVLWKRRDLRDRHEEATAVVPPALVLSEGVRRRMPRIIATVLIAAALVYGANFAWHKFASRNTTGKPFVTQTVNDLTVAFSSRDGELKTGDNDVLIEFRDSADQPVDVGNVNLTVDMNMPGMVMQGGGPAQPTGSAGQYRAKIKIDMSGDWNARVSFDGPRGKGETKFSLSAR